jgi:hypothetical protein
VRIVPTAAAVLALAAIPAAAEGASFFNGSTTNGAFVITASGNIETLQIFCAGNTNEDRELRFDVARQVGIGRKGKFSYSGIAYRYGPEGEPRGTHDVKLSGRLSGSRSISIRWTLPGCGTGTSVAAVQG